MVGSDKHANLPATAAQELEARKLQVELEDKKDQRQYDYAKQNLQVAAADNEAWRQHAKETLRIRLRYYTILALSVGAFSVVALLRGEKDLLLSLLHDVGLLVGGGGVGYIISYRRILNSQQRERRPSGE